MTRRLTSGDDVGMKVDEKPFRRWPLALIATPAAVSVWSGWVGLGGLCGFGPVRPLPGVPYLDHLTLNLAITLPIGVESYGAYAMGAWLNPRCPETAKKFARRSSIGALLLGVLGQIIYHLLVAAHWTRAPWPIVVLVSGLPVVTVGLGAALYHLMAHAPVTADMTADTPMTADILTPVTAVVTADMTADVDTEADAELTARSSAVRRERAGRRPVSNLTERAMELIQVSPDITGKEAGPILGLGERQARRRLDKARETISEQSASSSLSPV